MTAAPICVAIVGGGIIGRTHADAILRHPRLRIAAVVDPVSAASAALAERVAAGTGTRPPARYETLTAALADGDVDLVAVCTPSGLHAGVVEEALAAGRHVVLEKPLDATLPSARRLARLAAAAEERGQVCSVISQHRFDPASVAVSRAVAEGRLGRLTSAVASVAWWRGQDYYDSAAWRGTWQYDGGGAAMNQGIHTVDLLLWLLGRPVEVFGYTGLLAHERIEVEDVAVATVRFASGALAVLHATTAAYPGLAVRLQVHGSRGSAVIHDDQVEYLHPDGGVPADQLRGAPEPADGFVVGHLRQYRDIVDAIEHGRPPAVRVPDALLAFTVVKAVYLAATLGRPVLIDDVLSGAFDHVPVRIG
ncbi:Gfo/Idh/MocA family protein [Planosporangium mesophilum]|uniref:Oxidoreductase n=1 Tax=Planosporangium mesophilum TaxID=689768 RepID=A0A8J3X1X4_9ACTN|nr:Gfo/Idh/MocA family oxidoreductase [Planosporangium mesophilum]NJC82737.1 Gfo/Idh/MocA family oxidoreductase [Planosporangium mesophilum]GII23794.1 oxidoreductase [Planosporangium mesophilum]